MNYVFPPAAPVVLPVVGSDAVFPVRRVYCVGQNYSEHAAEMGKGLDQGGPISAVQPVATGAHPQRGAIWLKVNGELRQSDEIAQMTWKVAEVIANLSTYVRLAPGDLIFTETPAGVSTVLRGDVLEGAVEGVGELRIKLV